MLGAPLDSNPQSDEAPLKVGDTLQGKASLINTEYAIRLADVLRGLRKDILSDISESFGVILQPLPRLEAKSNEAPGCRFGNVVLQPLIGGGDKVRGRDDTVGGHVAGGVDDELTGARARTIRSKVDRAS